MQDFLFPVPLSVIFLGKECFTVTAIVGWFRSPRVFHSGGGHQDRMRSQESGPKVSYLTLRPDAMQRVSVLIVSALRLVTSLPRRSLKLVSDTQSRALSSLTCSKVQGDPPSPPSNPGLLLHPRCRRSWHEKAVIPKDKAAQNSFIRGDFGPVLVEISFFTATSSCRAALPERPWVST